MATKSAPKGKKKLLSLHLNGVDVTVGMAELLHDVLFAVATRSQNNLDSASPGSPQLYVNAAGDFVIYVSSYSV